MPSFEQVFLPVLRKFQSEERFEKGGARRPIRSGFYRKMSSAHGFAAEELESSRAPLAQTVARIDAALERGPFFVGDFTLAECCTAPLVDRMDDLGMGALWAGRPRFAAWLERVRARPSFATAFMPGSRLSERPEFAGVLSVRSAAR